MNKLLQETGFHGMMLTNVAKLANAWRAFIPFRACAYLQSFGVAIFAVLELRIERGGNVNFMLFICCAFKHMLLICICKTLMLRD